MNSKFYLYGVISSYKTEDTITSNEVREFLEGATTSAVDVHINSPGGSVFEGVAIYNLLKQSNKTVNIYIDSIAASAASFVAMAGNAIFMAENAMFMIHKAWVGIAGNSNALKKTIELLEKADETILGMYKKRFKGSEKQLRQFFEDETYFTAAECLKYGFTDQTVEGGEAISKTRAQNMYKESSKLVALKDYSQIEENIKKRTIPVSTNSIDKDLGITPEEALKAVKAMNALNKAGIDTSGLNPKELAAAYDNSTPGTVITKQSSNGEDELNRLLDSLYGPAKANNHISSQIYSVPKKTDPSNEEEVDRILNTLFGRKEFTKNNGRGV